MHRAPITLLALLAGAGCDRVFGLERPGSDAMVPTGFDEDGDGIDNAMDSCPGIPHPDQSLDADLDGIGDPCDPHPDAAGDVLRAAFFFDDPVNDPADWQPTKAWRFEQGSAVQPNRAVVASLVAVETHALSASLSIEVGYRPLEVGGAGNQAGGAIDGSAHRCFVEDDVPSDQTSQLWLATSGESSRVASISPALAIGALARISLTRDAAAGTATLRCRLGAAVLEAAGVEDRRGELAVSSSRQPMRLEYVLVYDVAP
jgi:hypothetical protein